MGRGKSLALPGALIAFAALLALPADTQAKPRPIAGKLSKSGYTVIALAADGTAKSVNVKKRWFKLRPPAQRVTLHLRSRSGIYAGPIVITRKPTHRGAKHRGKGRGSKNRARLAHSAARGHRGHRGGGKRRAKRRIVLGVRAGATLGPIRVLPGRGYAVTRRGVAPKWIDERRWARASHGAPVGTGRNVGRVRSKVLFLAARPPGDPDADAIPDSLDLDDDGDLVLDDFDRTNGASGAVASSANQPGIFSALNLDGIENTVNANAGGLSVAAIDSALSAHGSLGFPTASVELDCGGPVPEGLPYCAPNGTGALAFAVPPGVAEPPFPACCDPDGNSFGTLTPPNWLEPLQSSFIAHHATTGQIHPGDLIIERFPTDPPPLCAGSPECALPVTVPAILATVPALVSYDDGAGHSMTVSYPVPATAPGSPGGSGAFGNPFPVKPGSDGHVRLTLTVWRPQRQPIPPEEAEWIDVGNLFYTVGVRHPTGPGASPECPPDAYSTADPNLTLEGLYAGQGGVRDSAADAPANPANTLTFSVDATRCLEAGGSAWNGGEEITIQLGAHGAGLDNAFLGSIYFKRS
jgi:hypothetical protein